ncbi:MAG: hypothetical protein QOF76_5557 [Solirubrobacteraceae bacterium]|jgi:hypothetical protein|nr:hypothetical protein [Solirubrobacteraceae bacterium]
MRLREVVSRVPEPLRMAAPVLVAVACALLVVVIAGTSPADPVAPPPQTVAAAPPLPFAPVAADALTMSRQLPIAEVEKHYRDIAMESADAKRVAEFRPLYDDAERTFGVSWRLIASIHRQETAFSAAESTYHGRNFAHCCAGPMQFNLTNGPVSTWQRYRDAFRQGLRPAHYPHRTMNHPSIYDDYDAIMAAGKLLHDSGADGGLGRRAWYAAYDYYGHDLFGITYADQVTGRAIGWARHGFCANCDLPEKIVAEQYKRFGAAERVKLVGEVEHLTKKQRRAARKALARKRHRARVRRHRRAVAAKRKAAEEKAAKEQAGKLGRKMGHKHAHRAQPKATPTPTATARPKPTRTPKPHKTATPSATPTPSPDPTPTPDLIQGILHPGGTG